MPAFVKKGEDMYAIVYNDFEKKILAATRAAKRQKNKHVVNTLEKLIDYTPVYKQMKGIVY